VLLSSLVKILPCGFDNGGVEKAFRSSLADCHLRTEDIHDVPDEIEHQPPYRLVGQQSKSLPEKTSHNEGANHPLERIPGGCKTALLFDQLRSSLHDLTDELSEMRQRKEKLEREIRNFTKAIADSGPSKYILDEIVVREKEISVITDRVLASSPDSVEMRLADLREFVENGVRDLCGLLRENAPLAKQELHKHLLGVQMYPAEDENGVCYIAEGTWDLLGIAPVAPKSWVPEVGRFELVAGGGFEPPTFGL
jgi:hypothetical protein